MFVASLLDYLADCLVGLDIERTTTRQHNAIDGTAIGCESIENFDDLGSRHVRERLHDSHRPTQRWRQQRQRKPRQ